MPDPEALLREMIRVCRTGGTVSVMGVLAMEPKRKPRQDPLDRRIEELLCKLRKPIGPLEEAHDLGRGLPIEGFVSKLPEAFPEEFGEGSPARAEAEELLRLVRERQERRLRELRAGYGAGRSRDVPPPS